MLGSPQEMYLASSSSCLRTYGEPAASHQPPDSSPTTNCTGRGDEDSNYHMLFSDSNAVEKEHMFDKVVTPSDVGKLNRLVIPKQHAERYFPLDSSTAGNCMLLNFEDRNGKPWRFRYSYWNSSQSYVMTKGWSRFVKDKKLDAGDPVSFQRGVGDLGKDRLFIDWRHTLDHLPPHISLYRHHHRSSSIHSPWNPIFLQHNRHSQQPGYNHPSGYGYGYGPFDGNPNPQQPAAGSIVYLSSVPGPGPGPGAFGPQESVGTMHAQRRSGGVGVGVEQMVFESVPVVQGKAAAKRLRLFGVNMDCPISESDECDILSSTTLPLPLPQNAATSPASTILPILHHLLPHTHRSLHSSPSINPTDDHHNGKPPMSLDLHI